MTSGHRLALQLGLALFTVLGLGSIANAQYAPPPPYAPPYYQPSRPYYPPPRPYYPPPPPPRAYYRGGLVLGASLGGGTIAASGDCPQCGGAISGEVHIGAMVNPRTAVMFEFWGLDHPWSNEFGDHSTTNSFWTAAAQVWLTDILWLKGGIGLAHIDVTNDSQGLDEGGASAVALFGAVGLELVRGYNSALDIQFRAGNGFYSSADGGNAQNYAFMVGFSWY